MNNIMVPEDLKRNTMRTSELTPYVGNAKKHPEWQVEQIANSIQAFGFNDPIAIWQDVAGHWVIVEGHGRLLAAKQLGMEEVPVIRLDQLDDEGRRAYTLAHNKLTMNTEFDPQILDAELDAIEGLDMTEFGFDMVELGGYGTDFSVPDRDAPLYRHVALEMTQEQLDVLEQATSRVDRTSVTLPGGNEMADKVTEILAEWLAQRT